MAPRLAALTKLTLETAPSVCHECIWWQTGWGESLDKRRWIEKAEKEWGNWGTVYYDEDGRVLGSMQFGPAHLFPRAADSMRHVSSAFHRDLHPSPYGHHTEMQRLHEGGDDHSTPISTTCG